MRIVPFLAILFCSAATAAAAPFSIDLVNPVQFGNRGDQLVFSGTYTNTGQVDAFVTQVDILYIGDSNIVVTQFEPEPGSMGVVVPAGGTTPLAPLFSFVLALDAPLGIHFAEFGAGFRTSPQDPIVNADRVPISFTVLQPIPEPATWMLIGTGTALLINRRRRRRNLTSPTPGATPPPAP